MKSTTRTLTLALLVVALAASIPAVGAVRPERSSDIAGLEFRHPDLVIETLFRTPADLPGAVSRGAARDLDALGVAPEHGRMDVRSGRWASLLLSDPLIAASGVDNFLDRSNAAPGDAAFQAEVWRVFSDYLSARESYLRVDVSEMPNPGRVTVHENGDVIQIWAPRVIGGIPVRGSAVSAVINHGNLVLLGADNWGDLEIANAAQLDSSMAAGVVLDYLIGFDVTGMWRKPVPLILPVANGVAGLQPVGSGLSHRLAWAIHPSIAGEAARWEALVDAGSGELLSFQDTNQYATAREVKGGAYPVSNDGMVPDGVEQLGTPMPFADVSTMIGTQTTDAGGNVPVAVDGNITADLTGPFVRMADQCGAISLTSGGDIDFGGSGGIDCTTPGFGGAGNTHASRTGFYELNRIIDMGRGQLPANGWLQNQLVSNMNINNTCNAFWNGQVNFYRSGGGCSNTGEIAGIFDHEWGHGMDANDATPGISNPGEGIPDIYAALRLNDSCIGRNFFPGGNCNGYGDPCTQCSGVRDIDWANRASGLPHDYTWSNGGQCGSSHCKGYVYSESAWDLLKRDLPSVYGMDSNHAHEVVTRLTYIGAGGVSSWFSGGPPFGGCAATSGYMQFLAADDDNGNVADGTPHMQALFDAFDRHEIACNTPAVQDSGCVGGPTARPAVTATPQDKAVSLSWGAVAGASEYQIFQTDGVFQCDFGKIKVGSTTGTSFVAENLQNTRDYSFTVVPIGPGASCMGPASRCDTVDPQAGPNLVIDAGSMVLTIHTGDGDDFLDNCEMATIDFDVINSGIGTLNNVEIVSVTSPSHPSIIFDTTFPTPVSPSTLLEGETGTGSFDFTAEGLAQNETVVFMVEVTADELGGSKFENLEVPLVENDFEFFASKTFDFESDDEGWAVTVGTFARDNTGGGGDGTTWHQHSSAFLDQNCDQIESPVMVLDTTSTLTLWNNFDIEPFSANTWYDRANVGIIDEEGIRTAINPDGGRLYNADSSGPGTYTGCNEPEEGWADAMTTWAESSWSSTALDAGGYAGQPVRIDVTYGTDALLSGDGFRFDQVTVTDVELQAPDGQSDVCAGGGISCDELRQFRNRCEVRTQGNRLQGKIALDSFDHDGETMGLLVDGVPKSALITGRVGRWNVNGASSGVHTILLVDPAGCFPEARVRCP